MKILIDGDVIAYRCGFAAEKTRYDLYHAADITREFRDEDGNLITNTADSDINVLAAETFVVAVDAEPVETFDNAKLCKAWLQVQGKEKAQHYIRVPRKEIDDVSHALHSVKVVMDSIEYRLTPNGEKAQVMSYFSCPTPFNWRTECYPEYKANRKDARKPFWYDEIRAYMQDHYECETGSICEADDLISMEACKLTFANKSWVIASIDKDFLQIVGDHYNWVKEELVHVDVTEAIRNLAVQRIMGDSVDNIKGCPGVGDAKARAHLFNSQKEELEDMIFEAYEESYDTLEEARWQESVTTAMVTLPTSMEHVADLMEDVEHARQAYQESQAAGERTDDGGGPAPDQPATAA